MSYRGIHPNTDQWCFPDEAILRLQPRAAGPLFKELVTQAGPYESIPFDYDRGLLVIDPRWDDLPIGGPGWESKTA